MAVRTFIYPTVPTAAPLGAATEAKQDAQIALATTTNTNVADIELLLSQRLPGSLAPVRYDEIDLTYVASGNGVGEISTVTYSLSNVVQKVLTLTYDSSNRLINVI